MLKAANWQQEKKLWQAGFRLVAGIDEVGRGAWAGPVVSAAVVFKPEDKFPFKLFDSKIISAEKREQLAGEIKNRALGYSVGVVEVGFINKFGIGKATQKSFRKSLSGLSEKADFILIDAFYIRAIRKAIQLPIKHGDALCASIAAASILAKVYRDNLLTELHDQYPQWGFGQHKGYGTKKHQAALKKYSFSAIHRLSFNLEPYLAV
jgi:ribonuclease HII